jgi:putative transposase
VDVFDYTKEMPRQVRIEYAGALYHVMARGDRREAIVFDDEDRRTFLGTLGQACERSGFRVHAYVLMSNHYHLLLETPEPNLSAGMGWFQNAYTRRINVRHKLWGHVFGGRYKAILVEAGNCYWAVLDYIHLNPVRAGLVNARDGMESYPWSSLAQYLLSPGKRFGWMEAARALEVTGCKDTASGRRKFLRLLEERVDWEAPGQAGLSFAAGEGKKPLALGVTLRRGWFFGTQEFGEKLKSLWSDRLERKVSKRRDGYTGREMTEHGQRQAETLVACGLAHFGLRVQDLKALPCNDWRKVLMAERIHAMTTAKLDWIRQHLAMGDRSYCCRLIQRARQKATANSRWRKAQKEILDKARMSRNHD